MRGSISRRGRAWSVTFDEPSIDGMRRQRTKGGFQTRRDAQQYLIDALAKLAAGTYASPSKLTVGEYLTGEWLPAVAATVRPLTRARYASVVAVNVVPRIGGVRRQALSGGQLNALYADLERDGLALGTRRLVHAVLSRALRDAERWGRVNRNVARHADPPARGHVRASAWTGGELARFLAHVRGDRLAALWRLAATTGMRRGELLALTWRALDLDGARLSVEQ